MNDYRYQHINPEPLLEALGGDPAACRHMFSTFAGSAATTYARLEQAIEADDAERIRREAHSLKSSTALVGADSLTALLKQIEEQTKAVPPQSVRAQQAQLQQMFAAVSAEVQHFLGSADTTQ